MFKLFEKIKGLFIAPSLKETFEELILQEAVKESKQDPVKEVVNPQITDAVTQIAPEKPKRARTAKGKLKADDKSTPNVNEAWEGGKAPAKKPRTKKK